MNSLYFSISPAQAVDRSAFGASIVPTGLRLDAPPLTDSPQSPQPLYTGESLLASQIKLFIAALFAIATLLATQAFAQSADALFAQSKTAAAAEHKNVLLVFSASWCGPCKLYERFLEDPEMMAITAKAFVVQRIDVGEQPGDPKHADTPDGVALRTALGAQGEPGYPFIVITDANGNPIVNSYRNGIADDNIGYPAVPKEFDWYIEMLKHAAPALSPAELAATRNWLQAHAPR